MCNNHNLDRIKMNAYIKFGEILSLCSQDIERNRNLIMNKIQTLVKGHNFITNAWKMMCNNPNQDLININVYTKIVSEYDQEIPQSQTADKPMAP